MKLFHIFKKPDFQQDIKEYEAAENAFLIDVRSPKEYRSGHIPGSHNIPLKTIHGIASVAENKDVKLYVYCQSGARSSQAASALKNLGYTNVKDIGGIASYTGRVVK